MRGGREILRIATRAWPVVSLIAWLALAALPAQAALQNPGATGTSPNATLPDDPRALYQALNELRPDGDHVYAVGELNLRRDVVSLKLSDGKLAFLQPLGGRVTGAVFTGAGHVLATPRDRGERRSLAQFLGVQPIARSPGEQAARAAARHTRRFMGRSAFLVRMLVIL